MAASAQALAQLTSECESEGLTAANSEKIAVELARIFGVKQDEIGLLRMEKDSLVFVHPAKLHNVGRIPLNSPAVAVRTAHSKHPELINNFSRTRHASFFEMVDISSQPGQKKPNKNEQIIQKLMSVPVVAASQAVGVIQICRKGATAETAGPDFTPADLQNLLAVATALAKCFH